MKYVRLYADDAGRSRFDEVEIDLHPVDFGDTGDLMNNSAPIAVERMIFASVPVGFHADRHKAPHRQYFLQLTGVIEVEGADGRTVRTGPGDITLIEDTGGSGHITRVIGDVPVTGAFVQLPG